MKNHKNSRKMLVFDEKTTFTCKNQENQKKQKKTQGKPKNQNF